MPGTPRRAPAVLVLAALAAALFAPLLFGGEIYHFRDFGRFYRPVKSVYLDRLAAGELPIWMPEINAGTAVHGELVHAFLYPPNVLLFAGETFGWGLYFAAHVVLAGLGTRALARRLGASPEGALLAAVAFAGSGYLVAQTNHVPYFTAASWSPLLIVLVLSVAGGRWRSLPWLALAFAAAALAGEPFTLLLTVVFLGVLVLAGLGDAKRGAGLVGLAVSGLTALFLASPALLPALSTLPESVRGSGYPVEIGSFGSLHPIRLLTLLVPEACGRPAVDPILRFDILGRTISMEMPVLLGLHLGAVTLVLALAAPWRRSRAARWLGGTAAIALLLSLGTFLGLSTLVTKLVPGMSVFRYPHKFWLLATLAAALLAGLAANRVGRATAVLAAAGAAAALIVGAILGNAGAGVAGAIPFALAAAVHGAPARTRVRLLTLVLAGELIFFGLRLNPTADLAELSPRRGVAPALARRDPVRIFTEFLFPPGEAERRACELSVPLARNLDSLAGIPHGFAYSFGYDPTDPDYRMLACLHSVNLVPDGDRRLAFHRLLRISGTSHSVTNVDLTGDPALRLVAEAPDGIRAYEYVAPLPRARLYWRALYVPDYRAAQRAMADPELDPEEVLVFEGKPPSEPPGPTGGTVRIEEETSRRVVLSVRANGAAMLFLADAMAPGWTAEVNGTPVPIRPAFIAFRAVPVPEGDSRVVFRYEPGWLGTVPYTFGIGVLLLAALAVLARRRQQIAAPR